jgi:hypothetical protein
MPDRTGNIEARQPVHAGHIALAAPRCPAAAGDRASPDPLRSGTSCAPFACGEMR